MAKKLPAAITYLISILVILLLWFVVSSAMNASLILPGPVQVFNTLVEICSKKIFWENFAVTFMRVIASFVITVLAGTLLGFLCGISGFVKDFMDIPMSIVRSTPVVAFILVAYFWFNSNTVPVFVAVLMALPIMVTAITTGFEKTDKKYLNLAASFEFSQKEIMKYIKIPQCKPYFLNACISCFGLCWKVVAAGEVLCLPKKAVGTLLEKSQLHLETSEVIAQTIVLVAVSFLVEKVFASILKKRARKYE